MRRLQFLLAIRQLEKNKGFTLLNILGLTLGLTTFFFITLYVVDELSYDRYNKNVDRIYRVNSDLKIGDRISYMADAAPPVVPGTRRPFTPLSNSAPGSSSPPAASQS